MDAASFRHSDTAASNRDAKSKLLARFCWDRNITTINLADFSPGHLRSIARAAGVNPPSSMETWNKVIELILAKEEWLKRNQGHPAGDRHALEDRDTWVPEPEKPVRRRTAKKSAQES